VVKKLIWHQQPSICPQCGETLIRKMTILKSHYKNKHSRAPTHGEEIQFKTYQKGVTPYSDKDFKKPKIEVSGGRFSLK
jgi:hypothetical protein